jgi:hypothetical protein
MSFQKIKIWAYICLSIFCICHACHGMDREKPIKFDLFKINDLRVIQNDNFLAHDDRPAGVPSSFDWAAHGRIGVGNWPGEFKEITGWGQLFRVEGEAGDCGGQTLIRNFQLYVFYNANKKWILTQSGNITGGQFAADYKNNASIVANGVQLDPVTFHVKVPYDQVFHFWPKMGRAALHDKNIGGILVLLQARLNDDRVSNSDRQLCRYLIGLGADYWSKQGAEWDHYKTNKDIVIGRLKRIAPEWRWFGVTTASIEQLELLMKKEFYDERKK